VKRVVLVNGVPASGKSTGARAVADRGGWPLLALDTVKEPFFGELGPVDRALNRKLGRAAYAAVFDLIAAFPDGQTTVVEAWFGFQPAEVLADHIQRAGIGDVAELWCSAPPEVIGARYAARVPQRAPQHPGLDYVPELIALAGRARPLGAYRLLAIDTTRPLDGEDVVAFLKQSGFVVS
jgi:glucokinase